MSPKPFRIERLLRPEAPAAATPISSPHEPLESLARDGLRLARARDALTAIVTDSERAVQTILDSVERIEAAARTLAASTLDAGMLDADTHDDQHPARNILDQVTHVYEACNIHDLVGQHAANIHAALREIENRMAHAAFMPDNGDATPAPRPPQHPRGDLLNGPRLAGDHGHVSQQDIDELFG